MNTVQSGSHDAFGKLVTASVTNSFDKITDMLSSKANTWAVRVISVSKKTLLQLQYKLHRVKNSPTQSFPEKVGFQSLVNKC